MRDQKWVTITFAILILAGCGSRETSTERRQRQAAEMCYKGYDYLKANDAKNAESQFQQAFELDPFCDKAKEGLAMMEVRENAFRVRCSFNLTQISRAMLAYEATFGHLPPAFVADKNGRPMHSWRVLLLPFLDGQALYDEYHFDEPWDGPHNRALANRMPAAYHCPSAGSTNSVTSYVVIVGPHTALPGAKEVQMAEIKHPANTIMMVEAAQAGINWLEPRDLSEKDMQFKINGNPNEIGSLHVHGANVLYCDGSTHYFADSTDAEVLKQLIDQSGK